MQAQISLLHRTARSFAEQGIPVFPCAQNGKQPAIEGGRGLHDATTDTAQIDAWWTENPNYNIGLSPHHAGWSVLDLDGQEAEDALAALQSEHGSLPLTYEVRTPRGGRHLYFEGDLPTSAKKLGPSIDTRGIGGYVLVPPSIVNGKPYEVINDADIAPVPDWIGARLRETAPRVEKTVENLDEGAARTRARSLLLGLVERGDVAISGRGGNDRTYRLACELHNLGLSPSASRELLEEHWNPHCQPPWDSEDLEIFCENATKYAQNAEGAWATEPATQTFDVALGRLAAEEAAKPAPRSRFYFEDDEEQDTARDPSWQWRTLIPDAATVLWLGSKGSFKSFLVQALCMSGATGVEEFGCKPERPGPAFYGAHEGRNAIKKPRKNAWKLGHDVEGKVEFYVARAPFVINPEDCEEFREQIRVRLRELGKRASVIVLDTVAKCMTGLDENNAKDVGLFTAFCDSLRDEFQCPVIAQHHLGKDTGRGSRGSSALAANFDTVVTTTRRPKTLLVSVEVNNHKDAEEPEHPFHFKGRQIGPSLVFFPITADELAAETKGEDPLDRKLVGAVLARLNAYGQENGVTTTVLAGELTPKAETESTEQHTMAQSETARSLGRFAGTKLAMYCEKTPAGVLWFLPAKV